MTDVLHVAGVTVRRGNATLLDDISLSVSGGEVVGLIGPNGAGKSTLMNVMVGDLAPDAGTVLLHGQGLSSYAWSELALRRAVLPQQTLLEFGFRAEEVVAMGRQPHPTTGRAEDDAVIECVMTRTDTLHLRQRVYPRLSGGEQSRVSLARVLAQETPLVLLDEPTASLDIRHQHDVMRIAGAIAAQGGTVVAILHDLNLALAYADRIGVLDGGKLVAFDEPWQIAREDLLTDVFDCQIAILPHPERAVPLIVPLGANTPAHQRESATATA